MLCLSVFAARSQAASEALGRRQHGRLLGKGVLYREMHFGRADKTGRSRSRR